MVVCVECLPADKPWDVVFVTRRSSGVAPRACVCACARVRACAGAAESLHTYMVCVECLPADKPWDVVSVTLRTPDSGLGLASRAAGLCARVNRVVFLF